VQAVVDKNFIRHLTELVCGADPVITYVQDLHEGIWEGKGREGKGRRVPPLDLNPGDATASDVVTFDDIDPDTSRIHTVAMVHVAVTFMYMIYCV